MINSNNNLDWYKWKKIISGVVNTGKNIGFSDKTIELSAKRIGDFIVAVTEPDSESEKMFLNLWKTATNEEKRILTRLLIKLVDDKTYKN